MSLEIIFWHKMFEFIIQAMGVPFRCLETPGKVGLVQMSPHLTPTGLRLLWQSHNLKLL